MNQFEKMMLAINVEKVLQEMYEDIDKANAKGITSLVFELQGDNLVELAMSIDIALTKNKTIKHSEMEMSDGIASIYVTWENDE